MAIFEIHCCLEFFHPPIYSVAAGNVDYNQEKVLMILRNVWCPYLVAVSINMKEKRTSAWILSSEKSSTSNSMTSRS